MDFFDVKPHVGLPLPTAQHQVIHFLGARARSLQDSALSDALNHLQEIVRKGSDSFANYVVSCMEKLTANRPSSLTGGCHSASSAKGRCTSSERQSGKITVM